MNYYKQKHLLRKFTRSIFYMTFVVFILIQQCYVLSYACDIVDGLKCGSKCNSFNLSGCECLPLGCNTSHASTITRNCIGDACQVPLKTTNLCPKNRSRFKVCVKDPFSDGGCICRLKLTQHSARCNKHDVAVCSKGYTPVCSNATNTPVCNDGKIACKNNEREIVDLTDTVQCKSD